MLNRASFSRFSLQLIDCLSCDFEKAKQNKRKQNKANPKARSSLQM